MRNRPYVRKMLKNPGDLWRRSPADVKLTYPSENGNPTWLFDTQMICSVVFKSPVRLGYWVSRGSNQDRDWLAFVPKPEIT